MALPTYIPLRVRSAFSLLEGAMKVGEIADLAKQHDLPAVGLTDRNNLFAALEFSQYMAGAGVQPIMGVTLSVTFPDGAGHQGPIAVFAKDEAGWMNLMQLASRVYLDIEPHEHPHVPLDRLAAFSAGLIVLSGGLEGPINPLLAEGQTDVAHARLAALSDLFGDRFYVELQRYGVPKEGQVERALLDWAYAHRVPLVATNDAFFADPKQFEAHDALLCISDATFVGAEQRRKLTKHHCFRAPGEMAQLFSDLPEALENTIEIARRCAVRPRTRGPILPKYADDEAETLRAKAAEGLRARLATVPLAVDEADYWARLEFELNVIIQMGFAGYFLIVADFIQWSKTHGVPVGPGRGSGAGSLVAWVLTITNLDPLRFGLLFERFLNPERVSMPDFDIDFCQERREEVIDYVCKKYGRDRVAQIITFGSLQARAVIRDVGRVLQLPLGLVDRLAKMVPSNPANPVTLQEAINLEPRLREARREDSMVDRLLTIALQLEGLYRNASTHAAGIVIGDRPLVELSPLYQDPRSDLPATQYNMKWVESAGLVKFDFLGLKTLTVLDRARGYLKQRGLDIDFDALPLDDEPSYALMASGATIGVFQLESTGMRDTLRKLKPGNIDEVTALISLYRPGPMENIDIYVQRKFGQSPVDVLHPSLEAVLRETYGVIIYQEQVMQIAQVLSGYSLGEADLLRRAMGKKKKEEMDAQKARFAEGAAAKGVDAVQAGNIFELVAKFAGYGFNKSHAAAYAVIAYQTAWLKANHPTEFIAASMSLDLSNSDKLAVFYQDAKRGGVTVLPPCVNRSFADFACADGAVLYALGAVRNVGLNAMQHVVDIREAGGPFKDIFDFMERVDPRLVNKRALENLAKAGAFDAIHPNRAQIVAATEMLLQISNAAAEERTSNQVSLFGDAEPMPHPPLPQVDAWTATESLDQELSAVGFYLSGHPLDVALEALLKRKVVLMADAPGLVMDGLLAFRMAGVVRRRQEKSSANSGEKFAFLTLSDPTGEFEMLVPPETLSRRRDLLEPGESVVIRVRAQNRDGEARFFADEVEPLNAVLEGASQGVRLKMTAVEALGPTLKRLQAIKANGGAIMGELNIEVPLGAGRTVEVRLENRFPIDAAARGALISAPGVVALEEV
jgi:DNA polymerase-3 subunit alpha